MKIKQECLKLINLNTNTDDDMLLSTIYKVLLTLFLIIILLLLRDIPLFILLAILKVDFILLSREISSDILLTILKVDFDSLSSLYQGILFFINDLIVLSIFIKLYYKDLRHDFNNFFNINFKDNLKLALKYWLVGLSIMCIGNILIILIMNGQLNNNEEAVRSMIKDTPLYMAFSVAIFAPITEELIFRKSIRDFIKNKYLFACISGMIFGGLHVISSINSIASLVYLIPYCALGISFGLLYTKSNNIFSTIIIHSIHNTLALVLTLL